MSRARAGWAPRTRSPAVVPDTHRTPVERALARSTADGRCRLLRFHADRAHELAFDAHPFDRLVGWGSPDDPHRATALVLPAICPPSMRLGWPAGAQTPRAIYASCDHQPLDFTPTEGWRPAEPGLITDLVARGAGRALPLATPLAVVLLGWWVGLLEQAVAQPSRRYHPHTWPRLAALRPDLLLAALAGLASHAAGTPDPFGPALARPDPVGAHLLGVATEDWVVVCADRAQAVGVTRLQPGLCPTETAWLGPVLVAGLEMAPPTRPWRDVLRELALDVRTPAPLLAGALELAEQVLPDDA